MLELRKLELQMLEYGALPLPFAVLCCMLLGFFFVYVSAGSLCPTQHSLFSQTMHFTIVIAIEFNVNATCYDFTFSTHCHESLGAKSHQ